MTKDATYRIHPRDRDDDETPMQQLRGCMNRIEQEDSAPPNAPALPWRWTPCEVESDDVINGAMLYSGDRSVFTVDCGDWYGLSDETARFICLAVNQHHALVAALKAICDDAAGERPDAFAVVTIDAIEAGRVVLAQCEPRA